MLFLRRAEDRRVAQHIHVCGRAIQQNRLLGVAHGFARSKHGRFGLRDGIGDTIAVEHILRDAQTVATRGVDDVREFGRGTRLEIVVLVAGIRSRGDPRAIPGERARHVLILDAHGGALGV